MHEEWKEKRSGVKTYLPSFPQVNYKKFESWKGGIKLMIG